MPAIFLPELRLNAELSGPTTGRPLVLLPSLGTSLRIWDGLVAALPDQRILRLDLRGHGASDTPKPPYAMGALIRDAEQAMAHFDLRDAVVLGCGIGGVIAQGLAVKRTDLVSGLVLSNSAVKIGYPSHWQDRIELIRDKGLPVLSEAMLQAWLGRNWQIHPLRPQLQQMFESGNPDGWIGCAQALSGTDFYTPTAAITLPTLVIAGANDGITPPDLVRETADLIQNCQFALIHKAGHLPMLEQPQAYATLLRDFLAHATK